jgi:hypothetical protein
VSESVNPDIVSLLRIVNAIRDDILSSSSEFKIDKRTGEVAGPEYPHLAEAETRETIIDPILAALGWNIESRNGSKIERRVDYDRRADYVLYYMSGEPFAVVEAKRMHEPLHKHEKQLREYMESTFTNTGVLTNGLTWKIFKISTDDETGLVLEIENILEDLVEPTAARLIELIGFANNHAKRKKRERIPKPPSPLDDGWVER